MILKSKKSFTKGEISSVNKLTGRVGVNFKNGLKSTASYLGDVKDLRVGMFVLVGKVNNTYVIINKMSNVPGTGMSVSLPSPANSFLFVGAAVNVTEYGEIPKLEWPYGYEHMLVGSLYEGWSLFYKVNNVDQKIYSIYDARRFNSEWVRPIPVYYNIDNAYQTTVKVNTPDNIMQVLFVFKNNKTTPKIDISMVVTNISGSTVTDVRIKRHNDADIDTGGWDTDDHNERSYPYYGFGWADFMNFFDIENGKAVAYNTLRQDIGSPIPLISGYEAHKFICYGVPTPIECKIDDWSDWYQRANYPFNGDLPYYGDLMISLTWDLGDLAPTQQSQKVTAIYMFDTSYTLKVP